MKTCDYCGHQSPDSSKICAMCRRAFPAGHPSDESIKAMLSLTTAQFQALAKDAHKPINPIKL